VSLLLNNVYILQVLGDRLVQLFNSLTFVMLAGNPLHCNCELRWFRHWLTNDTESFSSKVLDSADILCVSPPNMTGLPLNTHQPRAYAGGDGGVRTPPQLRSSLVFHST